MPWYVKVQHSFWCWLWVDLTSREVEMSQGGMKVADGWATRLEENSTVSCLYCFLCCEQHRPQELVRFDLFLGGFSGVTWDAKGAISPGWWRSWWANCPYVCWAEVWSPMVGPGLLSDLSGPCFQTNISQTGETGKNDEKPRNSCFFVRDKEV